MTSPPRDSEATLSTLSHPEYFQTPSDITNTFHNRSRRAANPTHTASPDPTGGFLRCLAVRTQGSPLGFRRTAALSPQDAPQTNPSATHSPTAVVKPALFSWETARSTL